MPRSSKAKRAFTPGAVTPGLPEVKPKRFKSPVALEQQKYQSKKHLIQLHLEKTGLEPKEKDMEIIGLDLSLCEEKALHSLQVILDRTDYKGHGHREEGAPVLKITPAEFYEEYGLEKITSGGKERYPGRQAKEARKALDSLTNSRLLVYKLRDRQSGEKRVVTRRGGLIRAVWTDWSALPDEMLSLLAKDGMDPDPEATLIVECGLLLTEQIGNYYALKRRDMIAKLQELYPGRRVLWPLRLTNYILTVDRPEMTESFEILVQKAGLTWLLDQRKKKPAKEKLQEVLDVIVKAGYLLSWEINEWGNYVLKLNLEECSRARRRHNSRGQTAITDGEQKAMDGAKGTPLSTHS